MSQTTLTVQQLARTSGVSVRTLHHYDAIGLLRPRARSAAGYRLYGAAELVRLQQILLGRELGLTLEQIGRLLDDPAHEPRTLLVQQRAELVRRRDRIDRMLRSIDAALTRLESTPSTGTGIMNTKELFDGFDPSQHEDEARSRWGDTDAWRIAAGRTRGYSKERWAEILREQSALYDEAAALAARGVAPDALAARALAERHRLHVERWFYPCSATMHGGLADLYESDERFAATIDRHGAGLTPWLAAAMRANARG